MEERRGDGKREACKTGRDGDCMRRGEAASDGWSMAQRTISLEGLLLGCQPLSLPNLSGSTRTWVCWREALRVEMAQELRFQV